VSAQTPDLHVPDLESRITPGLAAVEDPHAAEMGFEIHQDVISDGLTVKRGACGTEHDVSAIVISPLHDGGDVSSIARTDNHLRDKPVGARI